MPKQRLTSLDIHALSSELQSLVSYRLQNIYDINSRTFLLKFGLPDSKKNIIIESGFRIHLTTYSREKSSFPSHFVEKLRKFLRTRRLTGLFQVGRDRILVFSFTNEANEEKSYHLVFEFFSAGNIILLSSKYEILHVLRTFRPNIPPGADPAAFQVYEVGARYSPLETQPRKYEIMTRSRLEAMLKGSISIEEPEDEETNALMPQGDTTSDKKKKTFKKKKEVKNTIRKVLLSGAAEYGAQLVEQIIRASQIDGNTLVSQISDSILSQDLIDIDSSIVDSLLEQFHQADEVVKTVGSNGKGYISTRPSKDPSTKDPVYEDFIPFKLTHLPTDLSLLEYDTFNIALDTFFSHAEATKLLTKHIQAQNTATSRLTAARTEHENRLSTLRSVQEQNVLKARLLEMNMERVEEALKSVNGLVARGMDWGDIERLIDHERSRGNPVAEIILKCLFKDGKLVLGLREEEEDESGDETDEEEVDEGELVRIEVDLGLSVWANAREYFDRKKVAAEKESRTAQSSSKALKNAERKITADLKRNLKEEKPLMKALRETKWFEKFYWFISSEGYLILGARDSQQSELLIRKYFRKGDIYVHSDLENSCVVIIKNPVEEGVIPPGTLAQAGVMAVATSRAWDAKQVTSAWWVPYSQVQTREGGYDVRGKKNFLPPAMLVLGYGILWTTEDEETMERHARPLLEMSATEVPQDEPEEQVENDEEGDSDKSNEAEDKYNLDQFGSASEEEEVVQEFEQEFESALPSTKRHLSAKQRRDLKKGKPIQDDSETSEVDEVSSSVQTMTVSKPKSVPKVRGKKGKIKKMKARYADQSDEERELARKLLGAKPTTAEKPKPAEEVPSANKVEVPPPVKKVTPIPRPPKPVVDEPLEDLDLSLKGFIASPKSGDIISDAVALCAPWSALTRYKYKIKLTPGTTKKGKAARAVIGGFLSMPVDETGQDTEKMSPGEKELLMSLKDEDIIPCIWPKSVKVVGGKVDSGKGGKKSGSAKGKGKK